MADTHGLKAGDTIYLSQDNTQAYLDANGWSNVSWATAAGNPFREQIVQIDHVDGNTITLKSALAYDMDAGFAKISSIHLLSGIHLSDFTVTTNLGPANPYDFINTQPAFDGDAAILVKGTIGATLDNISVTDAASHSFDIRTSLNVAADNLSADGAANKGTDGNGYGLQIYETFDSSFTNLSLNDTRHAVVFSAWQAEVGNTVQVTDTNRDINFHSTPDLDNVVTVDHAALAYNPSQNTDTSGTLGYWPIVGTGGSTHALTDIYGGGNVVKFGYAVDYAAGELIYGRDGGAYLNGKDGQDTLVGGTGDDMLVGGINKDTMTGGAGVDTYIVKVGDNYDTITDFVFGAGGDKIVLTGTATLDSMSDLTISQVGADVYVKYGANATLILLGHSVQDVNAANIVFDPSGLAFGTMY